MSWTDWACLGTFIVGFLLFLYGANNYNALVGYIGVYLWFGAIVVYLILYVHKEITKKANSSKTVKTAVLSS